MKRLAAGAIIIAILVFFTHRFLQTATETTLAGLSANWTLIILSIIVGLLGFTFLALGWGLVLKALGHTARPQEIWQAFARTEIAKYVPGTIWPAVGRVALLDEKAKTTASTIIDALIKVLGALLVAAAIVGGTFMEQTTLPLTLLIAAAVITLAHPKVLNKLLKTTQKLTKKQLPTLDYRYSLILTATITYAAAMLLFGIGFTIFAAGIATAKTSFIGFFALSWAAGFLAIIMPGGLGVREGALALLLAPTLTEPIAIAVAALSRLWWMTCDGILFLTGWLYGKSSKKH